MGAESQMTETQGRGSVSFDFNVAPRPPVVGSEYTYQQAAPSVTRDGMSNKSNQHDVQSPLTAHGAGEHESIPEQNTSSPYGILQRSSESTSKEQRRQRNTMAARKYRQKRLDRIAELEDLLAKTEKERDNLRLELERWKTKAELLEEFNLAPRKRIKP